MVFSLLLDKLWKNIFILPVRFYQYGISPYLRKACRFTPSCSEYMIQAIDKYGPIKGLKIGLKRLSRCHPLGNHGYDPLP